MVQHESLCPKEGECVIARIVDQSGNGNHLVPRDDRGVPHRGHPGQHGKYHYPVDASKHKIWVGGDNTQAYGMYFEPGMGYKNNKTTGVPTGDDPETMYAVMTGKRFGNGCCFDYGRKQSAITKKGVSDVGSSYARQFRAGRLVQRCRNDGGHLLGQRALAWEHG